MSNGNTFTGKIDNIQIGQALKFDGNGGLVSAGTSDDIIGHISDDEDETHRFWGHKLMIEDDQYSCVLCGEEQEVPEIMKQSTGFREVVCKMMAFGHFKNTRCNKSLQKEREQEARKKRREYQKQQRKLNKGLYDPTRGRTSGNSITDSHITLGDSYKIDGEDYIYRGNDMWQHVFDNRQLSTTSLLIEHRDDAIDELPDPLVTEVIHGAKVDLQKAGIQKSTLQDMSHTNSSAGSPKVDVDGGGVDEDTKKSIKQKFAEKLLNRK